MASGIGIGELVWVTQGKTDHMAMYIGDIRKPDSDNDEDDSEDDEEEYVSIKWTTTNMIEYVPYSSVRLAMNGQRRRRIVPNHYMAVPAPPARAVPPPPPPTTNTNSPNSKSNTTEASAATATATSSGGGKKVFLTDKSSSSIDKKTVSDKNGKNGTLKKSAATAIPDMGKCRFCNEMFSKYGIKRHETTCMRVQAAATATATATTTNTKNKNTTNKLKAKGKKRSNTFASSTTSASDDDDDDDELDNNDNDDDNPFEEYNDPNIKIGRHYLWEWENSSDSHTYRQKLASQKHASTITTTTTTSRTDKKKLVPRNYLVYNKNNHKSTNNILASITTDVRTPRSWEEGYGMMIQFYKNCGHCNISTNHPILGKFIRDIRSEHKKYCKFRSKKKKNPTQYKNQVYRLCTAINRNCRRLESGYHDMTRVDWRKVSKLNTLGFIFRPTTTTKTKTKVDSENNENENENEDSYEVENEDDSIHSELLDDDDDEEEEEEDSHDMLKLDSDESVDYKSGDDSESDSEDTDDDDDDDDDDGSNNSINKNNNNQGGLSAYEKLRLNKIKRNEDKLKELGLYKFVADTKNDAKGKKKNNNKAQQVLLTKNKQLGNDDNGNEESKMGKNEYDLNFKSKMGKKEHDLRYRKGSKFFNNKMIRRDLNLILQPPTTTTNNGDDENDNEFVYDEYLTVSSLDEIDLTDSCNSNKKRNDNGELTFPIQLCRLLNSSKQLGIDKIVSWSTDGNSFHVYSESDFVTHILKKTTFMTKMVSILNAFGQFNIISPILGKNCRTFQHRSIEEAGSSNDPTKRLFYRGVSVDVLRKIKSRREERKGDNGSIGSGGGGGGGGGIDSGRSQFNRQPIKKRKYADHYLVASPVVWKDDSTFSKDGSPANAGDRKRSSSGRRILTIDRLSLGDGSSIDRGGDDKKKKNIKSNKNIMASNSYQYDPEQGNGMSRSTERRLRQTSDGCLHPKGGKEQYLMNNGTYDIPAGKRPANLSWDPIRGLWVPPDRLNDNNGGDDSGDDGDGDGDGGTPSSRGSKDRGIDRAKRRTKDGCLLPKDGKERYLKDDGTYRRPDGARPFGLSWHKIRGLWVPSESLRNGIGGDGDDYDDDDTHYKVFNRETERKLRLTKDGCLIPKGGKEKYLRADGYYKMPDGARPSGLSWNKIRGLWAPPERLNEGAGSDGDDEDEDETISSRTTDGSLRSASLKKRKRSDDFVGSDHDDVDGYSAGHDIDEINYDPDQTGQFRSRNFKNRFVERQARRTRDGCLLPKRQPQKKDDGTYEKPKGHEPKNLHWDTIRGLWTPDHCLKKKTDGSSSLSISSSSSDDEQIIRASDANLFHHSSPMWRDFFQFKKHNRERRFQARTKGNPTGIIGDPEGIIGGPQLNKSNWGKIERLMQRHHHTINTNTSTIYSDDGDTHFV